MKRVYLILFSGLIFFSGATNVAFSKEIGEKLNLTPTFAVQETYDSNIFKMKNDSMVKALFNDRKMDDLRTYTSFGLTLDYPPTDRQKFTLNARKDFINYHHYKDQNYDNSSASGKAAFKLGDSFFIRPSLAYSNKAIPRQSNLYRKQQDFVRLKTAKIEAGYDTHYWEVLGFTETNNSSYELRADRDIKSEKFGAILEVTPYPTNRWYLHANEDKLNFINAHLANDNRTKNILLGTIFNFSDKNQLKLEGGWRKKIFSNNSDRNYTGLVGEIDLAHQISRDTILSLNFSRDVLTSYFVDTIYYVNNTATAKLKHQLTSKISSSVQASNSWSKYKEMPNTTTNLWQKYASIGTSLSYEIDENIACSLGYEFQRRKSNLNMWEFNAHEVTLGVTVSWK